MAVGGTTGNDHVIGNTGLTRNVQAGDVITFDFFNRFDNKLFQFIRMHN